MITSEEIKRRLWNGANELRGSMDASRYKDYMLGLMFYKFLSDKTLETFKETAGLGNISEEDLVKEYNKAKNEYGSELEKTIQDILGYYVSPQYLYHTWISDINSGDFEVQKVIDSLNHFERTIAVSAEARDFQGLFSNSTLDLTNTALGSNLNERSKNIKALILLFADLNMVSLQKGDVLGDAYEYLIGQFAMESGKKAGEFYTPHQVSEIMAQIVAKSCEVKSLYDPTVGSGSLLLTVKKHLNKDAQRELQYYGQEKNTATYNLTRILALSKIATGEMDAPTFHRGIEIFTSQIAKELLEARIDGAESDTACPRCGRPVVFYPKLAKCQNPDCGLTVWRTVARKELTDKQLAELLTKGKTGTIRGFVKNGGGTFDAALTLDDQFKTSFVFEPRDTPRQGKRNKRK